MKFESLTLELRSSFELLTPKKFWEKRDDEFVNLLPWFKSDSNSLKVQSSYTLRRYRIEV